MFDKEAIVSFFHERFGIPEKVFSDFEFVLTSKKCYMFSGKYEGAAEMKGLLLARLGRGIKPTTSAIQLIGRHATRNVIDISEEKLNKYLMGYDIEADGDNGYVILRHGEDIIGVGLLKSGVVKNQLPKHRRLR